MKSVSKKQPFCGDFTIIKSTPFTSISYFSKLFIAFLLVFSSTLSLNFKVSSAESNSQQIPVKKALPALKKTTSSKTVKGKIKVQKNKKRVVIKKDTLKDIDPASASSPLYDN